MGKIITPRNRLEFTRVLYAGLTNQVWRGRVSEKRLADHIETLNQSFKPGGVNAHCAPCLVLEARIVRQKDGQVLATYVKPWFTIE